ncbi:MAG: ATP-binding protein [Desulfobacterales bacterium]
MAHGIKLTLYRILQESMNNIIKHSQADTVDIGCTFSDGHLWLTIHDNGCGFNVDEVINGEYDELKGIGLQDLQRVNTATGRFI